MFIVERDSCTSMWHVGEGFVELPIANMRVIDMSLGRDGVQQSLLRQVLAIERPEYESQKQSLSSDIIHLRREVTREQVLIFGCGMLIVTSVLMALILPSVL